MLDADSYIVKNSMVMKGYFFLEFYDRKCSIKFFEDFLLKNFEHNFCQIDSISMRFSLKKTNKCFILNLLFSVYKSSEGD